MAKVSAKENLLMMGRGETPYYVPWYSLMGEDYKGECAAKSMFVDIYTQTRHLNGGKDAWGVTYVSSAEAMGGTMPDTTIIMMHDIADWRKIVKFPKANDYDWKRKAEEDIKRLNVNRDETGIIIGSPTFGMFQQLVGFMGFEGALCALYTDPDECKELFNAMLEETLLPATDIIFDNYDFDLYDIGDDTCAKQTPFFSPEIYEDVFLPVYTALARRAMERGMPVTFHNCGRMQEFLPFMEKFNVRYTNPAQETNDLEALTKEYKGRMVFCGGWDWDKHMPINYPEFDAEEIRESVRHSIDTYSKEGNYCFCGTAMGMMGSEASHQINAIIREEAFVYGKKVYGYTGE